MAVIEELTDTFGFAGASSQIQGVDQMVRVLVTYNVISFRTAFASGQGAAGDRELTLLEAATIATASADPVRYDAWKNMMLIGMLRELQAQRQGQLD